MTRRNGLFELALFGLAGALTTSASTSMTPAEAAAELRTATANCGGQPCDAAVRGFAAFLDREALLAYLRKL